MKWQVDLIMKGLIHLEKKLDKRGRWRNKATSFMMSPEERADLDVRVSLSGLTKQEYMVLVDKAKKYDELMSKANSSNEKSE